MPTDSPKPPSASLPASQEQRDCIPPQRLTEIMMSSGLLPPDYKTRILGEELMTTTLKQLEKRIRQDERNKLNHHCVGNYFVTGPVEGGYAWWDVRMKEGGEYPNFTVASFFRYMPGAEQEAKSLAARLNQK